MGIERVPVKLQEAAGTQHALCEHPQLVSRFHTFRGRPNVARGPGSPYISRSFHPFQLGFSPQGGDSELVRT